MLGEQVYESLGKVTEMKLLPNGKRERTVITQGRFIGGEEFSDTYTSTSETRPDGTIFIEFFGTFTTKSGLPGRYTGMGNGTTRNDGVRLGRGATCYSNPPGKYERLNGMAVVWETEVGKDGLIREKAWEWK